MSNTYKNYDKLFEVTLRRQSFALKLANYKIKVVETGQIYKSYLDYALDNCVTQASTKRCLQHKTIQNKLGHHLVFVDDNGMEV